MIGLAVRVSAGWLGMALVGATGLLADAARADDMESDAVYLPAPSVETLAVRNPLGTVRVQGWDEPQIRIIAEKRAGTTALIERLKVRVDLDGGNVRITTGFYLADHTFNALPLSGSAIDLTIEAPRKAALTALTFTGDIQASGFRAGAHLSSQGGQIRVADLVGPVDTKTLQGNQWLEAIRGSLLASGVVGDMELSDIDGKRVDVSVYKGQIVARAVVADVVRLRSTVGTVLFIGSLKPGARYDLATRDGDVRLVLRPADFTLAAHAPSMKSGFALAALEERGERRRGSYRVKGPGSGLGGQAGGAQLQLASTHGGISIGPLQ